MNEELKNMNYDDLVQLVQDKEITLVEYVNAQDDLCDDYANWCKLHHTAQNEISAAAFLEFKDQEMMNGQLLNY